MVNITYLASQKSKCESILPKHISPVYQCIMYNLNDTFAIFCEAKSGPPKK